MQVRKNALVSDDKVMQDILNRFMAKFNHLSEPSYLYLRTWASKQLYDAWNDGHMFTSVETFTLFYTNFAFN